MIGSFHPAKQKRTMKKQRVPNSDNKIGIIMNSYILNESPTIYFLSQSLVQAGYHVDIFTNEYYYEKNIFEKIGAVIHSPNVISGHISSSLKKDRTLIQQGSLFGRAYSLFADMFPTNPSFSNKYISSLLWRLLPHSLVYFLYSNLNGFCRETKTYASFLGEFDLRNYGFLIVVEPEGLMAYHFSQVTTPFIYLSLELNNLSFEKNRPRDIFMRIMLKNHIKKAAFTIIQDETRKEVFRVDNHIPLSHKFVYLPVSFRGKINRRRTDYFRNKFGITEKKRIVLYAGSIMPWACIKEIVASVENWDERFVFVIHGRRFDDEYLKEIREISLKSNRIYISTDWVDYEDLNDLISSSDIGIFLYSDETLNNRLILNASGKAAAYLRSGLPIITKNFEGIKNFYKKTGCGECFETFEQIGELLLLIDSDYSRYRENAFETFLSYYSFDKYFKIVLNNLKTIPSKCRKPPGRQIHVDLNRININVINKVFWAEYIKKYFLIRKILKYNSANVNVLPRTERAFPGDREHLSSGHYKTMLKRYIFAGAFFCKRKKVLDSCCGLGWGTYLLSQYADEVTAFDIDQDVFNFCRKTWQEKNIRWKLVDVFDMSSIADNGFDVAVAMETIEHFSPNNGEKYIVQLSNKLKKGGIIIGSSSFPVTRDEASEQCKTNPFHLHIFTQAEITEILKKNFREHTVINNWMFIAIK
jgi:2-polyprenyl-3-methyl-5-hydroxy-6-metoxy-1,4-benzoquinol methylase